MINVAFNMFVLVLPPFNLFNNYQVVSYDCCAVELLLMQYMKWYTVNCERLLGIMRST